MTRTDRPALTWAARLTSLGLVAVLTLALIAESAAGPSGWREWAYLGFFPVGFSIAYLAAWRWPRAGALFALACMFASQLVIARTFDLQAYIVWAILCVPALLFLASTRKRNGS